MNQTSNYTDEVNEGEDNSSFEVFLDEEHVLHIPQKIGRKYEFVRCIGNGSSSAVVLVHNINNNNNNNNITNNNIINTNNNKYKYKSFDSASVNKSRNNSNGASFYACKVVSRQILVEENMLNRFEQEIRILQHLNHPNIISVVDIVYSRENIYLIMDFCENGELFKKIVDDGEIMENEAKKIFRQIVSAVNYIHARNIAHRDLKPENILLDRDNNAKLADFGLCHTTSNTSNPRLLLKTPCGSPFYAPPEIIKNEQYDGKKADIWSLGIVLFTMVTGALPWKDLNPYQLFQQIQEADIEIPIFLSNDLRKLLMEMTSKDPTFRPSCEQILTQSPWLMEAPDYVNTNSFINFAQSQYAFKNRSAGSLNSKRTPAASINTSTSTALPYNNSNHISANSSYHCNFDLSNDRNFNNNNNDNDNDDNDYADNADDNNNSNNNNNNYRNNNNNNNNNNNINGSMSSEFQIHSGIGSSNQSKTNSNSNFKVNFNAIGGQSVFNRLAARKRKSAGQLSSSMSQPAEILIQSYRAKTTEERSGGRENQFLRKKSVKVATSAAALPIESLVRMIPPSGRRKKPQ